MKKKNNRSITEAKYTVLKVVIDAVPKGFRGMDKIYDNLGTSYSMASLIRKSTSYEDYLQLAHQRYLQAKKIKMAESIPTEPAPEVPLKSVAVDADMTKIFSNLQTCLNTINDQLKTLTDRTDNLATLAESIYFITEHMPIEPKSKLFKR